MPAGLETSNKRIVETREADSPEQVIGRAPITSEIAVLVNATRKSVSDILKGHSDRLLVVVGPCSVHDPAAALEYAEKLAVAREDYKELLEIVMRVYFEKPRSTVGWKGLINDPGLDGSFDINKGLKVSRQLLLDINKLGVPAGTEFLDIVTGQYYSDLVSWGAIGARTTESQVHREMASGLSCPVGFKNGTDGNVNIAMDAVIAAREPHWFLSPTHQGRTAIMSTTGNDDAHIILRGGQKPNYDAESISAVKKLCATRNLQSKVVVDCSHANSGKRFERQIQVASSLGDQIRTGENFIAGCMIESHLLEGRQDLVVGKQPVYGQSITDACLGWSATERLLGDLAHAVADRNS